MAIVSAEGLYGDDYYYDDDGGNNHWNVVINNALQQNSCFPSCSSGSDDGEKNQIFKWIPLLLNVIRNRV